MAIRAGRDLGVTTGEGVQGPVGDAAWGIGRMGDVPKIRGLLQLLWLPMCFQSQCILIDIFLRCGVFLFGIGLE